MLADCDYSCVFTLKLQVGAAITLLVTRMLEYVRLQLLCCVDVVVLCLNLNIYRCLTAVAACQVLINGGPLPATSEGCQRC